MNNTVIGIMGFAGMLFLMLVGMPIGFAMGLAGFVGIAVVSGFPAALGVLKTVPYRTMASYALSVIPLFVLMGEFAFHCALTERLYSAAYKTIGRVRGGLAVATIAACGIFSAISGSSLATAGAMGRVTLPEMRRYRYDPGFAAASVAAGGTVGNLIPPGVMIIIYSVLTEQSISKMIMACVIPGTVLLLMYMLVTWLMVVWNPRLGPPAPRYSFGESVRSLASVLPVAAIGGITLGGLYTGVFTATEAAAVGAFITLLWAAGTRQLTGKKFVESLLETVRFTGFIFTIVIGAMIFNYFLAIVRLPETVANFVTALPVSRVSVCFLMVAFYLVLGALMDEMAMIFLTVPVLFPAMTALGVDPILLGVLVVTAMEQGLIAPPVGMNLFIVKGMCDDVSLGDIFRAILPYLATILAFQVLLILFPGIATWLPHMMARG